MLFSPGHIWKRDSWTGRYFMIAFGMRRLIRFRFDFRARRERELAGHHYSLICVQAFFDHREIAILALSWFHFAKIDSVIRFQNKNKRPTLTDLDRLRGDQHSILEHVQNETN